MQPTIGRIVEYWPRHEEEGSPHAAIVTATEGLTGYSVSLAVFHPIGGLYFLTDVRETSPNAEPWDRAGRWSWPERSAS